MSQNKSHIVLPDLDQTTAIREVGNDTGFLNVYLGTCQLEVICDLTGIDTADVTFTVEEQFGGDWYVTGESDALASVGVAQIVSTNFPLMGKGSSVRVSGSGAATAWTAKVHLIAHLGT